MTQIMPDAKYTKTYTTVERASKAGRDAIAKLNPGSNDRVPRFIVAVTGDGLRPETAIRYTPVFVGGDPALLCHVMQLGYMIVN